MDYTVSQFMYSQLAKYMFTIIPIQNIILTLTLKKPHLFYLKIYNNHIKSFLFKKILLFAR